MNPLLTDLSEDPLAPQRLLLEIIWDSYAHRGIWPIYEFVKTKLYRATPDRADARTVILTPESQTRSSARPPTAWSAT
jgi:hypothetical protein